MDNMDSIGIGALVVLVIAIVIFLILREFWCWYWKINKLVKLQEQQVVLLKRLVESNGRAEIENIEVNKKIK